MSNSLDLPLGWLSPTGEFVNCQLGDHVSVAQTLIDIVENSKTANASIPYDDQLLNLGWVHISISCLEKKEYSIYWKFSHRLTPEQFIFLDKYFEDRDIVSLNSLICWDRAIDIR